MIERNAASRAIRAGVIVALIALALAIALIAWQERLASGALSSPGAETFAGVSTHLRIAMLLLLISLAAVALVAALVARTLPAPHPQMTPPDDVAADPAVEQNPVEPIQSSASPVPLARMGHLMSVGSLLRGFCHELNNQLGPVQGYAELLCEDMRLSELHRRQVARIRDATRTALADVRSFGVALSWSGDPTHITRLGEMVSEAARSAQATMATRIEIEVPTDTDVEVTATESEVGQAILHLCAAAIPLLGKRDARIRILVDSLVGAPTAAEDDIAIGGHRLEMWSDPTDRERTKVQFGALRPSWRYGRVCFEFEGHGWTRDLVGRMFDLAQPDEAAMEVAAMALLGTLMLESGGVIMVDTCPHKHTTATLLWPARIAPEVGAPLELDTFEDELDALVIHTSELMAEELSRHLAGLGLRVASTTSAEAAMELVAEMGSRCHAIILAQTDDDEIAHTLRHSEAKPRIFQFEDIPQAEELERLAAELRRPEPAT